MIASLQKKRCYSIKKYGIYGAFLENNENWQGGQKYTPTAWCICSIDRQANPLI